MKNRAVLHAILLAFLLVLTQTLLLLHVSTHKQYSDHKTQCELCLAADNLNSSLTGYSFDLPVTPVPVTRIRIDATPFISTFTAKAPLPRSPPVI